MDTLDAIETRLEQVARAEGLLHAEKLALIAAADRAQANLTDGAKTMGEWVARRLDEHPVRARRMVRAARSMAPELFDLLRAGDISVARAEAYAEADFRDVDLAGLDDRDIGSVWREIRRTTPVHRDPDDPYLVMQPTLDETFWKLWGQLDASGGALVADALSAEADRIDRGVPAEHRATRPGRLADALVALALGESDYTPTVAIHLDERHAAPEVDGVAAQVGELSHALCVGTVTVDRIEAGQPMAYGTTTRQVSPRLRQFIAWRDGFTCTIDGCTSTYRLEPHHIIHAEHAGPTDPGNLTLLCWFHHHTAIHTRGFDIDPDSPAQRRRLIPPDT